MIDTKKDSKEEIKKLIQLLSSLAEEGEVKVNEGGSKDFSLEDSSGGAFASLFGEEGNSGVTAIKEKKERKEGTPIDFSGFMGLVKAKKGEQKEERLRIVPY